MTLRHRNPLRSRRARSLAAGATVLGVALSCLALSPATAAPSDPPGSFTEQNLAADRTAANFWYRIPALTHLGDGVVLAAWDGRPGSAADSPNPNSIVLRRSVDNGATWSPITNIAAGTVGNGSTLKEGYSDPSFVVDEEAGKVFAFFVHSLDQGFWGSIYGDDDSNRQVMGAAVIESSDAGLTWSEPRLITDVAKTSNGTYTNGVYTPVTGDVRGTFATSGTGIQLKYGEHAGRLIQQYAGTIRQDNGGTAVQAYSVYSDDHGVTWKRGEYTGTAMDENKVVELSDGRVMLNSRDNAGGGWRKVAISTDGGHSYGPVTQDKELPDPTNNASIIRLHPDAAEGSADAKKLLYTGSNNNANGNRVNGAARISCDDGETWPGLRTIDPGFFAYSSPTILDDGKIGVLWERNYTNNLPFAVFDEAWLNVACAPLSAPEQRMQPGDRVVVPVTVTNQEDAALSGTVTFSAPSGWVADSVAVADLAPGDSVTVDVALTAGAQAEGTIRIPATFTASDGRVSQFAMTAVLPQPANLGATLTVTNTSPARDVAVSPYKVGDTLSFRTRMVSTANVATKVTPQETNFTGGFLPTACGWNSLPAKDAYNCNSPVITLTQADIDRGFVIPTFSFTMAELADTSKSVTLSHTGAAVMLRPVQLGATVTGALADSERDLAADPYEAGDRVPYTFTVTSTSPVAMTVTPTAGNFEPFLPPTPGNCRYRELPALGSFTCSSAVHTVTEEEAAQGFFDASTSWTLSTAGSVEQRVELVQAEVSLRDRRAELAATTAGAWNDRNGNGITDLGDDVTWTHTLENTGNVRLDAVTGGSLTEGTLAPGASVEVGSETVVLDRTMLSGTDLSASGFTASGVNGATEVAADSDAATVTFDRPAAWDPKRSYKAGQSVSHDGAIYTAAWWAWGFAPGGFVYGPWEEVHIDADGTDVWTKTRIFNRGDVVSHEGETFTAQWWTRGQEPGSGKLSPWKR